MRQLKVFTLLIVCFFYTVVSLNAADIEDGLWLYLPMNEGNGENVLDHGPHKFETEFRPEPPVWVDAGHSKIDNALEFDGKATYLKIDMASQGNDIDSLVDEDKGITICAWVKVLAIATDAHNQTRQPIVIKGFHNVWEFGLLIYDDNGAGLSVWNCAGEGVAETSRPGSAPQATWFHQCGPFKLGVGSRVYINANESPVAQTADNGKIPCETGTRPVIIAHREDGQYLNAIIAEVYMWDRVLDIDEMELAMNSFGTLSVKPGGKLTTSWGHIKKR